jgi:hypothetical protein
VKSEKNKHFEPKIKIIRIISDEFTVPLCRGHHRELHRHGDEAGWWEKLGLDPLDENGGGPGARLKRRVAN